MKDFLLEHYKVVNERLTQSDRNRDVWVGAYLVLTVGSLSFAFSSRNVSLEFATLGFLFFFGIFVAIYVAIARAWHCEYTRVLIAIHRAFLDGDFDLSKAAREFKQSKKFGRYFNIWGTEFMAFLLTLLLLSFELVLIFLLAWNYLSLWPPLKVLSLVIVCVLPFLVGIIKYKRYLNKRESEFPEQCYSIQEERKK
jgi:hypothetical protein